MARRIVILIVVFCLTTLGNGFGWRVAVTLLCRQDDVVHRLGERTPRSPARLPPEVRHRRELRQETELGVLSDPTGVTPATWPCESSG